jgi:hypothetical protein
LAGSIASIRTLGDEGVEVLGIATVAPEVVAAGDHQLPRSHAHRLS